MSRVPLSPWRTNLLRAAYAPLAVGLAVFQLPLLTQLGPQTDVMEGFVTCMLAALCILSFIGLARPIAMLPLLLFEVAWKVLWLVLIALPAWYSGTIDETLAENLFAVALVAPIILLIPWKTLPGFFAGDSNVV